LKKKSTKVMDSPQTSSSTSPLSDQKYGGIVDSNNNLDSTFKNDFQKKFNLPMEFINIEAVTNTYYNYEKLQSMAESIGERIKIKPLVAIICGSGLGEIADRVSDPQIIPYSQIKDFPQSTVPGHKGNLVFGHLSNVPVVCMQGRFHPYEGYAMALCTMPIRIFKLLGCKAIILTNAAGGVNRSFKMGDIMLLKDHYSFPMLSLKHPLIGPNEDRFGPRFLAINNMYCRKLRDTFKNVASDLNIDVKEGVYGSVGGPTYETITDYRMCQLLQIDTVGMSTTHEAVVALHSGLKVLAFSIVTDMLPTEFDSDETTEHSEIVKVAKMKAKDAEDLVINFLHQLQLKPELLE
jgi:purine-nucleoside phosphorylase